MKSLLFVITLGSGSFACTHGMSDQPTNFRATTSKASTIETSSNRNSIESDANRDSYSSDRTSMGPGRKHGQMMGSGHHGMMGGRSMSAEMHENMAEMHEEVAECIRQGKSQEKCREIMMRYHREMCNQMGHENCRRMMQSMMGPQEESPEME